MNATNNREDLLREYLRRAGIRGRSNFWTAPEYIRRAGWEVRPVPGTAPDLPPFSPEARACPGLILGVFEAPQTEVQDPGGSGREQAVSTGSGSGPQRVSFLPPLRPDGMVVQHLPESLDEIWAGWPGEPGPEGARVKILDREYRYNPAAFLHMDGGQWLKFRKNSRKWPRTTSCLLQYRRWKPDDYVGAAERLLAQWLEARDPGEVFHDAELMAQYVLGGNHREGLWCGDVLVGMNVWDVSPGRVINFRYSVPRPGEPYLGEHLRLLFYLDKAHRLPGWTVNDGGDLDNPRLREFKMSMNPARVAKVPTWTQK